LLAFMGRLSSSTNSRGGRNVVYMLSIADRSVAAVDGDALGTVAAEAVEVQVEAVEEPTLLMVSMLPIQPATLHPRNGKHLAPEIEHLSCRCEIVHMDSMPATQEVEAGEEAEVMVIILAIQAQVQMSVR
jgi:hypothetical protein